MSAELALGEGPAKPISVSLPAGTVRVLREAVGPREVSAFVASAVEQHLRDLLTDEFLAKYQAEHGAFTPEELAAAAAIWDGEPAQKWREAS